MFATFFNPLIIATSLSIVTGVLVHDTHIDRATTSALSAPMSTTNTESKFVGFSDTTHPHVERGSLSQAVHDLKAEGPRVQPRSNEEKKYLIQKYARRGHHAFDNYNMPVLD